VAPYDEVATYLVVAPSEDVLDLLVAKDNKKNRSIRKPPLIYRLELEAWPKTRAPSVAAKL
jgi:hypothetical protein